METEWSVDREYFGGRVKLIDCTPQTDARGTLLPIYFNGLPFTPCRSFAVTNVPAGTVRGGHTHRFGSQMLVCLQGCIEVMMRYESQEAALILTPCSFGVILDAGIWCQQTYVDAGSVLLAFASAPYDRGLYVEHST